MDNKKQKKQKKTLTYKILYPFVRLFFKKQTILYKQPVPNDEPVVFVCNHAQAFGPMTARAHIKDRLGLNYLLYNAIKFAD